MQQGCICCGKVLATSEMTEEPRRTPTEAASSPRPGRNVLEFSMTRSAISIESVPLGIIDFSFFFFCARRPRRRHRSQRYHTLPWFRETGTCCSGSNRRGGQEYAFVDCRDWRHEQTDVWQQVVSWAQNALKSASRAEGSFSVNFPSCLMSQTFGVFDRQSPVRVYQYDSSREGDCQLEEVPTEVALCDNSNDEEWL